MRIPFVGSSRPPRPVSLVLREHEGATVSDGPFLRFGSAYLKVSLIFSPACFRSAAVWSPLPSASRSGLSVVRPTPSLTLPFASSAALLILSSSPIVIPRFCSGTCAVATLLAESESVLSPGEGLTRRDRNPWEKAAGGG